KALDIVRSRSRVALVAEPPDRASPARADGRDLDLWAALGTLAAKQRAAVAYHYLGGLTYRAVAEILGGSEAAARRAAADGVAALRRALDEGAHGGGGGARFTGDEARIKGGVA